MSSDFNVPGIASALTFDLSGWTPNVARAAEDAPRVGAIVEAALAKASEAGAASMTSLASSVAEAMNSAVANASAGSTSLASAMTSAVAPAVERLGGDFASAAREVAAFELSLKHADAEARMEGLSAGKADVDAFELSLKHADAEARAFATAARELKVPALPTAGVEGLSQGMRGALGVAGLLSPALGQVASGVMAVDAAAAAAEVELAPLLAVLAPLIAAGAAFKVAFSFGETAIGVAADAEKTEIAFKTILGSAGAATAKIKELKEFAASTPLTFPEVAQTTRSLLNVGLAADDTQRHLQMLGDVATGAQTDLNGLTAIYTQVVSKGKADTMDLMQLANRGVPIYKALQAALHVSGDELRSLVEGGKIGFPQIQAAFEQMTGAGGQFHDAMKDSQGSFDQLMSTLSDGWREVQEAVGKVIVKNLDLKGGIAALTDDITKFGPSIVEAFSEGTKAIKSAWDATSDVRGVLGELIGIVREIDAVWQRADSSTLVYALTAVMGPAGFLVGEMAKIEGFGGAIEQAFAAALGPVGYLYEHLKDVIVALKWIRETLAAFNYIDSGKAAADDAKNHQGWSKEDRAKSAAAAAVKASKTNNAPASPGEPNAETTQSPGGGGTSQGVGSPRSGKSDDGYTGSSGGDFGPSPESLARATRDRQDAYVQALRNQGKAREADLAKLSYDTKNRDDKATTPEEHLAIARKYEADKAEIEKKYADQATKAKDDQAKKDEATADRVAQHELNVKVNALKAAGREAEAQRLLIEDRWTRTLAKITDPTERAAAEADRDGELGAFDAQQAERQRKEAERVTRDQARNGPAATPRTAEDVARASPVTQPIAGESRAARNRRFEQNQSQRRLAQLDLREQRFGLDDAGRAQRDRLIDLTGAPAFGPQSIDASSMPANGPRARQVADRASTAGRTPVAGASTTPTINAPIQLDAAKLARDLLAVVGPAMDRKLDDFATRLRANGYAGRAKAGS